MMRARGCHPNGARRGFTLIEIAIALAVIGFAVVAIIGVLPTGLQVQQDNKEDTIAGQDGALLLEAIRGGSEAVLDLENYVDSPITVGPGEDEIPWVDQSDIIGLLSTPAPNGAWTNHAIVRAISGSVVDKQSLVGFKYRVSVCNVPFVPRGPGRVVNPGRSTNELQQLEALLHDVTVELRWPVYRDGGLGAERRTFRSLVSGELIAVDRGGGKTNYFFRNQ